jgi:hypothetical protein
MYKYHISICHLISSIHHLVCALKINDHFYETGCTLDRTDIRKIVIKNDYGLEVNLVSYASSSKYSCNALYPTPHIQEVFMSDNDILDLPTVLKKEIYDYAFVSADNLQLLSVGHLVEESVFFNRQALPSSNVKSFSMVKDTHGLLILAAV